MASYPMTVSGDSGLADSLCWVGTMSLKNAKCLALVRLNNQIQSYLSSRDNINYLERMCQD